MIWVISYRLINSLLVRSYFSPDEYWQSLEVAHKLAYGYGELTWEWQESALRSIIHPGIFALFYYILNCLNLDLPWLVAYLPRILQGLLLAATDHFIYKVNGRFGLMLSLSSWFMFYAGVRTYSNSVELFLNALGLYLQRQNKITQWNIIIAISCMIRPTSIIIWLPSYFLYIKEYKYKFVLQTGFIASIALSLQILIDSWYFGKFTVTFYNFLHFNFLSKGSEFYGRQPWHWLITEGLPVVYFSFLPLLILGLKASYDSLPSISYIFALLVITLSPHKEYRFLLPFFPHAIYAMSRCKSILKSKYIYYILALQVPVAIYLSLFHQVGSLDVIDWLRNDSPTNVGFFINCHGTPFYSHIHKDIPMDFLHCKPFEVQETLEFFKNPEYYLELKLKNNYSHIVIWGSLYSRVAHLLQDYKIATKIYHAAWTESFEGYEKNVYFFILTRD